MVAIKSFPVPKTSNPKHWSNLIPPSTRVIRSATLLLKRNVRNLGVHGSLIALSRYFNAVVKTTLTAALSLSPPPDVEDEFHSLMCFTAASTDNRSDHESTAEVVVPTALPSNGPGSRAAVPERDAGLSSFKYGLAVSLFSALASLSSS